MEVRSEDLLYHSLDVNEISVLLKIYYMMKGGINETFESDFDKKILQNLVEKNFAKATLVYNENIFSLTNEGINICRSIMFNRIKENMPAFRNKIKSLPQRTTACLVNRIIWKDVTMGTEKQIYDAYAKPYILDESLWFERVLLKDKRITETLNKFYSMLESLGFIENIQGQKWCSPEAENLLKNEYKDTDDLTWTEEDSLKFFYFFYIYAQDQKNLINFSGDRDEFRSMFFDDTSPPNYWFSSNRLDPHSLSSNLGISEKRILHFLEEMKKKNIVAERYYPLSSFSFFDNNKNIFIIRDIKVYMDFITKKFLTPIVDSLMSKKRK